MTVTAPPRPPPRRRGPVPRDLFGRTDPEALIEEARQRARRRRRAYAAAAAAVALIGVSLAMVFGRPESSQSAASDPYALPVAPDDETAATIVARWGRIHEGWVLVYGDGRVIVYPEQYAYALPSGGLSTYAYDGEPWEPLLERRLTTDGLDLVRSGAVRATALFKFTATEFDNRPPASWGALPSLPAGVWADRDFKPYVPSRFAICDLGTGASADAALHRFPASARALLRGKEKTYTNPGLFLKPQNRGIFPVECFEVSAKDARALETLGLEGARAWPVLPHGDYVGWGG